MSYINVKRTKINKFTTLVCQGIYQSQSKSWFFLMFIPKPRADKIQIYKLKEWINQMKKL
jgi:hypothetical protein